MRFIKLFIIAFFLNLFWEICHSVLYVTAQNAELNEYVRMILAATLKDAFWITLIYSVIRLAARRMGSYNRPLVYSAFILAALAFSYADEKVSTNLGRWQYADSMPLVDGVGISPLLELAATGILAIILSRKFIAK